MSVDPTQVSNLADLQKDIAGTHRPAVMPKGSVIFYGGTLWHGGGANNSVNSRLALTAQYCEPWLRQQENFGMGTDKALIKTLSPDLQTMLGYSVHPPYIGMVDGVHPLRLLKDL